MNPYESPRSMDNDAQLSGNDTDTSMLANPFFWILMFLILLGIAPFVPAIVKFVFNVVLNTD